MGNALSYRPGQIQEEPLDPIGSVFAPGGWDQRQAAPAAPQPQQQGRGGVMGFIGNALRVAAPEAYKAGQTERMNGQISNALAQGDYGGAAKAAYGANDWQTGLKLGAYGQQQEAAQRKQEAQGLLNLLTSVPMDRVNMMAMEDPVGFEQRTGVSADEYLQGGQKFTEAGMKAEDYYNYVIQKAQAELGVESKGPLEINGQLVDPKTYDVLGDYRTPTTPKAPASGMVQDENGNWVYSPEYLAGQKEMRAAGRAQTNITMPGASQIGTIPQGYAVREDPNEPSGYRMYPIPGSKPGSEAEGAATAKAAMNNTFSAMLDGYLQLNQTGGVRNSEKGVADNFAAYVKTTPLGREYGKMTGAPDEAVRETIEALQPGIVQAIMSQPGMSARSMDSERELAFFIKSITSPTADFYANLSTLHALDMRFGSGQLIQQALQRGDITESDYEKITRSPVVNATSAMVDQKISELFTFDGQMPTAGQIGSAGPMGNSTTPMDLQGLLAADGTQVTEDDIQATMAKHGMTREEVIARIRGQ